MKIPIGALDPDYRRDPKPGRCINCHRPIVGDGHWVSVRKEGDDYFYIKNGNAADAKEKLGPECYKKLLKLFEAKENHT